MPFQPHSTPLKRYLTPPPLGLSISIPKILTNPISYVISLQKLCLVRLKPLGESFPFRDIIDSGLLPISRFAPGRLRPVSTGPRLSLALLKTYSSTASRNRSTKPAPLVLSCVLCLIAPNSSTIWLQLQARLRHYIRTISAPFMSHSCQWHLP